MNPRRASVLLPVLIILLGACDGRRTITSDDSSYVLSVRVLSPTSLQAIGRSLSWKDGVVPNARLIAVRRSAELEEVPVSDTTTSDANGVARFTRLVRGDYRLRIDRSFSASERAQANEALAEIESLVSTGEVTLAESSTVTLDISLAASGGSSLIFTEIAPARLPAKNGNQYYYGGYFKITNNADTTVSLAGKIFFDAHGGYIRNSTVPNGCSYFSQLERDPGGVWTRWIYRFPTDAKTLSSGASVILATDALNHRAFGSSGYNDFSRAEFEFIGPADVDNPLAANMIDLSPREYDDSHGWHFRGGRQVWGLASPLSVDTLPKIVKLPFDASQSTWVRIPAGAVLEIVRYNWDVPQFDPSTENCPSPILGNLDAADAVLLGVEDTLTLHRRASRTLPNGRVVYQRSRNSQADWVAGKATP